MPSEIHTTNAVGRRSETTHTGGPVRSAPAFSRRRRVAIRALAIVGLLAFALSVMIVLTDVVNPVANEAALAPAGSPEARLGAARPGESVHVIGGVAALLLGGSGPVALTIRPERLGSANHTIAAMLGSIAVMGIVGDPDNHGGQALPFDPAFLIFALPAMVAALAAGPWVTWRRRNLTRPRFLALSATGAPFVWYGVDQALIQRNTWPPLADPHHQAHWYMMSVLAFMIVLVAATAAVSATGWRPAAQASALAAITMGAVSLVTPTAASALPRPWAGLAVGWGIAGLALARRTSRRPPRDLVHQEPVARR